MLETSPKSGILGSILLQTDAQARRERDSGCAFTQQMRVSLGELHSKGQLDADVLLPLLWPDVTSQPERGALLEYMHKFELCHPLADSRPRIKLDPTILA